MRAREQDVCHGHLIRRRRQERSNRRTRDAQADVRLRRPHSGFHARDDVTIGHPQACSPPALISPSPEILRSPSHLPSIRPIAPGPVAGVSYTRNEQHRPGSAEQYLLAPAFSVLTRLRPPSPSPRALRDTTHCNFAPTGALGAIEHSRFELRYSLFSNDGSSMIKPATQSTTTR